LGGNFGISPSKFSVDSPFRSKRRRSGVVTISTDFVSQATFNFILMDGTGKTVAFVQQGVPGQMLQVVRSISGFSLVVAKASCASACTLGPGSTFGTLGP
jgi:hypothetical protein